jgi:hypothetical protein
MRALNSPHIFLYTLLGQVTKGSIIGCKATSAKIWDLFNDPRKVQYLLLINELGNSHES